MLLGLYVLGLTEPANAQEKQIYPVYWGETIGLGKQGLFIDTAPAVIQYVEIEKIRPPLKQQYLLNVEKVAYRGPILDVTFLSKTMAPIYTPILASVYFNVSEPEVRIWEEGGFDAIGIWYYNKNTAAWQPCYTRFVPEKLNNGKYNRLACIVMGNGLYMLGTMKHDPVFPLRFKPYDIDQAAAAKHKQMLVQE